MLVEPTKPSDLKGMCRAINRLSGGKMEQKASELDSVVTSGVDSLIDSATKVLSDATSAVKASLAIDISAVSNLAESNQDSINIIHSSLQTYESALSDATSEVKASALADFKTNSNLISAVSNTLSVTSSLAAVRPTTGWPTAQGVTLSFDNANRRFTVTDGGSAYYYIAGVLYTLGGNKTVVIGTGVAGDEGLWYIYFDGATLTASQTIWSFRDEDKALVAIVYWDATNSKEIFMGWEVHTFHMDGSTHARLHYAGGARWESGLLVSDTGGDTVNVSTGDIWDEDLNIPITDGAGAGLFEQVLSPAQLPIYYRDGASNWRIYETGDKAAATDVGYLGAGALKYNKLNGTWANVTVGLNNYVAYYVVATNDQTEPIALIMGQRFDNKLSDAKENNVFSGLSLANLPFEEMVVLARLILKDTATYTLEEVLDLRAYNIKGNITSPLIADHGALGGLGDDDHVQYALDTDVATYESALSDATSEVKASAASELMSTAKVLSDATSNAYSLASNAESIASTHKANDGTDHSFIDQDVQQAASPAFAAVSLGGTAATRQLTLLAGNYLGWDYGTDVASRDWAMRADDQLYGDFTLKTTDAQDHTLDVTRLYISPTGKVGLGTFSPKTLLTVEGTLTLKEQANADGDNGGYGQLWVKSDVPNILMFTDDAGTDKRIITDSALTSALSNADSVLDVRIDSVETRMLSVTSDMTASINTQINSAISDVVATAVAETASLATKIDSAISDVVATAVAETASLATMVDSAISDLKASAHSELLSQVKIVSDATSAAKASAYADFQTNSNLISNLSNTLSALSVGELDAISDMASANSNALSAVSNLAQSNTTAIASIETLASDTLVSLQAYESALSNATSEVKASAASELASTAKVLSDITSGVKVSAYVDFQTNSNLISNLSTCLSAVSNLAQSNSNTLSAVSNLAQSNATAVASIETLASNTLASLQAYESALSDATSGIKTSAASELASTAKVLSDATSVVQSGVTSANTRMLSVTSDMTASINTQIDSAISDVVATNTSTNLSLGTQLLSDIASLATMVDSAISDVVATAVAETASLATALASVESNLSSVIASTATSIVGHMDSAIASIETTLSQATSEAKASAYADFQTNSNLISANSNLLSQVSNAVAAGGVTESHLNSTALSLGTMVDSAISDVVATAVAETASLATMVDSAISDLTTRIDSVETIASDAYSLATVAPVGATTQTVNLLRTDSTAQKQAKIDAVPRYIPVGVTVTFQFQVTGTHTETAALVWGGFYGGGSIDISGNTAEAGAWTLHTTQDTILDFTTNSVDGIYVNGCSCSFYVTHLKVMVQDTSAKCFRAINCAMPVLFHYNYALGAGSTAGSTGIHHSYSSGYARDNYVSNLRYGIYARGCRMESYDNDDTGTQPLYGLCATEAATIGKVGATQPAGSTANEYALNGGVIR